MAVVVTLLTLSGPAAPAVAEAQAQPTDPGAPSSSVAAEEPPETTRPEDPTTTEPDEPSDTTEPEDPDEGTVPEDSPGSEDPTATDSNGSGIDDAADADDTDDALTWLAIAFTLVLLGAVVGWMLRRPPRTSGPPSDDDWPRDGELL